MQIHELANLSGNPASGTSFVVDNGSATRKIDYTALAKAIVEQYTGSTLGGKSQSLQAAINKALDVMGTDNAGFHNSIYRGKNLGTSFTSAQAATISAGKFDDIYLGDFWNIDGIKFVVADFNTFFRTGYSSSSARMSNNHIVVVPERQMYSTQWNTTATTAGGYIESAVRANIKGENTDTSGAEAKFIAAFGDEHVLEYKTYLPTAYTDGIATSAALTTCRVELMSEVELMGHLIRGIGGGSYEIGVNPNQFMLFRIAPFTRFSPSGTFVFATRTVANATQICAQATAGSYGIVTTTTSFAIRPFALIG